ncbi:TIR domain-containing protein [Smaragdicoccus niigatensis]|uniref:TIR domain-containing protein n=1 Tax=Smaragdicoccus niigatensis TaxID=359359 RepID=UPI00037435D4|nr:TIR domain-containing protein [Smaragdicoccus niigatensis]
MLNGAGDRQYRYDAFISYRTTTSAKAAKQLQRALVSLSKRHGTDRRIALFLDIQSLIAGELEAEIKSALESSRSLIVLLATGTKESPWVDKEIEYWLGHGGDLSRFFLVRHDPRVNLEWNEVDQNFAFPEGLPTSLSGLFPAEQKWLELKVSLAGSDETALVGLYAPIAGAKPEDLLLAEADFQQRRRRRTRLVAMALAILLVVAVASGGAAVVNWRRANSEATQARADANAAQALLATQGSSSLAIRKVLEAADLSSSASVRAALLAVSDAASTLIHAFDFPRDEAGYSARNVKFSPDHRHLLAWGSSASQKDSFLAVWGVESGKREYSFRISGGVIGDIVPISPTQAVACRSDSTPVVITFNTSDVHELQGRTTSCRVAASTNGAVAFAGGTDTAYVLDSHGDITRIAGATSLAARPGTDVTVLAGPGGIWLITPSGTERVYSQPTDSAFAVDWQKRWFVRRDSQTWVFGVPGLGRYAVSEVAADSAAVDSVPQIDASGFTGAIGEVNSAGEVRIVGTPGFAQAATDAFVGPYNRTRIQPMSDGSFVVVWRNMATIVWPPGVVANQTLVGGLAQDSWRTLQSGWRHVPTNPDDDAVIGPCGEWRAVFLRNWTFPEKRSLVTFDGSTDVNGFLAAGTDCGVVNADGAIAFSDVGKRVVIRGGSGADAVDISVDESLVAVLQSDLPIEVLSTSPGASRPWTTRMYGNQEYVTALGERRIVADYERTESIDRDGKIANWGRGKLGDIRAVHPAGSEVLRDVTGETRGYFLDQTGKTTPAAAECALGDVKYVPSPGFESSRRAAETAIAVSESNGVDCRTGRPIGPTRGAQILEYGIGHDFGRIMWRREPDSSDGSALMVTTWGRAGPGDDVTSRPLPDAIGGSNVAVAVSGDRAAGLPAGDHLVRVFGTAGMQWHSEATLTTQLQDVSGIALADQGSLLVIYAKDGTFELFDVATGRLVMANRTPVIQAADFRSIQTYESSGYLVVILESTSKRNDLEIPISVDLLVNHLCQIYRAPECGP